MSQSQVEMEDDELNTQSTQADADSTSSQASRTKGVRENLMPPDPFEFPKGPFKFLTDGDYIPEFPPKPWNVFPETPLSSDVEDTAHDSSSEPGERLRRQLQHKIKVSGQANKLYCMP